MILLLILAAPYSNTQQSLLPYQLLGWGVMLAIILTPVLAIRHYRKAARGEADAKIFAGIIGPLHPSALSPGEVSITFHTYNGLFAYFVQRRYDLILPADQAKLVLKRMLKHNCTWGMLSPGCVFIPFLSFAEYRSQMKKI